MGYEDNEQEIDLKAMFFDALYRWRSILVAGLIGALLLGAYKYWSVNKAAASLEEAIAEGTVIESDFDKGYLQAKEKIEAKEADRRTQSKKSTDLQKQINDAKNTITENTVNIDVQKNSIELYNNQIENAQRLIDETQEYLDRSVLMQAADDLWTGRAIYQVTVDNADPAAYRDPADQVIASYRMPQAGSEEMKELGTKLGLEADLLSELYSIGADGDANTVIVTAYGKDKAMAEEILTRVCSLVEAQKTEEILHQLIQSRVEFSNAKSEDCVNGRNERKAAILDYQDTINTSRTSIATANSEIEKAERAIENASSQIGDFEKEKEICDDKVFLYTNEINKMTEKMPSMIPTTASKIKSSIKWAILGFIVGCAVLFIIYIVLYVVRPLLRMPDDIRTVYGYPVLGVLNKKVREKVCAIDKWIMKAEGRGQRPGDDEIVKTAAVSIAKTAEPGSLVAVMTTLKENNTMTRVAEKLRGLVPEMQFVLLTEGISKASNVDELSRCDATVLLEERNATSMGKLTADVNQIRLFNKKVLGAIVL